MSSNYHKSRCCSNLRITLRHVRKGEFRHRDHLNDVGFENVFRLVEVSIEEVLVHVLLGRVIDKHVDLPKSMPDKLADGIF